MEATILTGTAVKKSGVRIFSFFILSLFVTAEISYAAVLSTDPIAELPSSAASVSAETAAAKMVSVEGDVKILKKGSENWQTATKNQTVEVGDQILIGKNSSADIAYDPYLLNISHLKENTKAEIRSLNPTDIYLEDGSIFSALDGLSGQGGYQIATPTAVAAVRGTHFDVGYDKASQKFTAASLPTGDENHVSKIFVSNPQETGSQGVEILENKQLDLGRGEKIQMNLIKPADPARLQAGKAVFAQMGQRMPQFQELRVQGKAHFQEMKQKGMPMEGFHPKDKAPKMPFKEKRENPDNPQAQGELLGEKAETQEPDPLENVRALDALVEENKPQGAKPFGSFRPQPQSGFRENPNPPQGAASPGQNGDNQNTPQEQKPAMIKPFGEFRPQSMKPSPQQQPGFVRPETQQNTPGFQPRQQGQQAGPNNPPPQEKRQGPPPQGPPKK